MGPLHFCQKDHLRFVSWREQGKGRAEQEMRVEGPRRQKMEVPQAKLKGSRGGRERWAGQLKGQSFTLPAAASPAPASPSPVPGGAGMSWEPECAL